MRNQCKHRLWGSNVKIAKYLPKGWQEGVCCSFLGPKVITLWD